MSCWSPPLYSEYHQKLGPYRLLPLVNNNFFGPHLSVLSSGRTSVNAHFPNPYSQARVGSLVVSLVNLGAGPSVLFCHCVIAHSIVWLFDGTVIPVSLTTCRL